MMQVCGTTWTVVSSLKTLVEFGSLLKDRSLEVKDESRNDAVGIYRDEGKI